jgi:SP family general alpha glucoside:H+ symporter-like MFS transporter
MVFHDGDDVARIDSKAAAAIASKVEDYDALVHDAAEATQKQEKMSVGKAIRTYPQAIFFSVILSLAVIMEG